MVIKHRRRIAAAGARLDSLFANSDADTKPQSQANAPRPPSGMATVMAMAMAMATAMATAMGISPISTNLLPAPRAIPDYPCLP